MSKKKKATSNTTMSQTLWAMAGGVVGFFGGWALGVSLGFTASKSMLSLLFALIGAPIGGWLALQLWKRRGK